ncbi:hypothetical protein AKJ09_08787 [Labilithrix luteola]|uniref:Uncharacterized protein n=1 Tax=Labilithrix luteola TaxID=1391654 RepID=A0A0K1Q8R7_9BACT|nr:hypothetical protein [Labilithrix luteola]AKV02124.1 hypothetical protein AKJ09_08787 [Labilithrix luteola]
MSDVLRGHRGISSRDLRELREKYARMLVLRQLHARSREEPDFVEPDPRPEMVALAQRWPGALREIDELDLTTIVGRLEALDRALARTTSHEDEAHDDDERALAHVEQQDVETWMIAQARFHQLLRGALAAKRWLGRERHATSDLRTRLLGAITDGQLANDAALWADELSQVARPPRGRLLLVVFARLERELGIADRELRASVFVGHAASHADRD